MNKIFFVFLIIFIIPLNLYSKTERIKLKPVINWETGFKGCIDTANIKLEEDPFFAFGTYACAGQTHLYKNNTLFRWNAGLGFSTYAGYLGFVNAAASYGYTFFPTKNPDFSLSVLGTIDFQTYCFKTPFFSLGCDLYAKRYLYDNLGFYADLGLFFDYSFVSFMPKIEFGVSFR